MPRSLGIDEERLHRAIGWLAELKPMPGPANSRSSNRVRPSRKTSHWQSRQLRLPASPSARPAATDHRPREGIRHQRFTNRADQLHDSTVGDSMSEWNSRHGRLNRAAVGADRCPVSWKSLVKPITLSCGARNTAPHHPNPAWRRWKVRGRRPERYQIQTRQPGPPGHRRNSCRCR